jgi:hypothetical protein
MGNGSKPAVLVAFLLALAWGCFEDEVAGEH